ncbi:MAG: murein biosynthesis integral membrane protein MurJ [Patescibacteria group bacterium]
MIHRLKQFASKQNSLVGATALLVTTTLLSNVLGLLRDRFLAQKITTDALDTYFAAFRVPDFLFNFLILGTVSAAFIPVFVQYRAKSEQAAWEVASVMITLAVVILVGLSMLLAIFMPALIPFIVPDFSIEKQALTIELARVMLIQPIFFGLSYLFSGVLNAMKRFTVYAIAPLIYTASIIVATLGFADQYGVKAVVWGVVIGAVLHMFTQLLAIRSLDIRLAPILQLRHPSLKQIFSMMWPRSIALGAMQLMLLVFTAIGSSLGAGSVAVYSLADNIQTMPTAVFALSFITALFPTISEAAAKRKLDEVASHVWRGIRYLIVIMVPSGVGIFLIRAQVVRLILGTGYFDWEATVATASTLGFFASSLLAQSLVVHLSRTFYALHDTRTPTLYNVIGYSVAILAAYTLAPMSGLGMGVPGLALAFSIGSTVNAILLYTTVRTRLPQLRRAEQGFSQFLFQVLIATVSLIAVVQLAKAGVAGVVDMNRFWGVLAQTSVACLSGALAYWTALRTMRVPELSELSGILLARFRPKLPPAVSAAQDTSTDGAST